MTQNTKTTVVIETHEEITIRRSRRVVRAAEVPSDMGPAKLAGWSEEAANGRAGRVRQKRQSLGSLCRALALKSATALAPLSRRMKKRT